MERQRVIARFINGRMLRGYVQTFSPFDEFVSVEVEPSGAEKVGINELKAIFFVKTFAGDKSRSEKKAFVDHTPPGRRVFVKFKDGEYMTGYIEGDFPWKKGFYLEAGSGNGFFLQPVDGESNNTRVFVVAGSVWDVTAMG